MSTSVRPVTSKARGICRHYDTPRGCFNGDRCKFLHGQPPENPDSADPPLLTPYDQAKKCRYFAAGYCKRGSACWFKHETGSSKGSSAEEGEEDLCGICYDKPTTYGLLGGCSHIFCLSCLKSWRDSQTKEFTMTIDLSHKAHTKTCPMCRSPSKFITPSSRFWKEGTEEKTKTIQAYKDSMAKVPCRYFQQSYQRDRNRPKCPFGRDCFYQHLKADGTPFLFDAGVDDSMRNYPRTRGNLLYYDGSGLNFAEGPLDSEARPAWSIDDVFRPVDLDDAGLARAAFQLYEVGAALDRDSGASTLERLRAAIDTVRDAIRNRDVTRADRAELGEEARNVMQIGDEVMERLEILTDQVLASVHELRAGATDGGLDLNGDLASVGTTPPEAGPSILRHEVGGADDDGASTASSMPDMASLSGTDESGSGDDVEPATGVVEQDNPEDHPADSQIPRPVSPALGIPAPEADDGGARRRVESVGEEGNVSANPAFVADGRGRVVWNGVEEGDKRGEEVSREAEESGGGREEGGVSGGFLSWLNTLF